VINVACPVQPLENELTRNFARGLWHLADPKISLASFASMFLGACAATAVVPVEWGWLTATVLGIFAIEIAKNASGEIFDFDAGVDQAVAPEERTPFSGGKRVLVDGLLTRGETWGIALVCYAVGIALGIWIALARAPSILWIGSLGVLLAYQYHAPPLKLSYRGCGEFAVALCYGPLIATGTYAVQTQNALPNVALAAAPLGLLIAAFLCVNELPDYSADKAAGKKTLVVLLGRPRAVRLFGALEIYAFIMLAALPILGIRSALGGLIALPAAVLAIIQLSRTSTYGEGFVGVQRKALLAFLLCALGQGLGFQFGR
jgi:1,4-dihydroxy-2-naphthoate octaprenyltransferase